MVDVSVGGVAAVDVSVDGVDGVDGVAFVDGSAADCVGGALCTAGSTTGCPIESDTVGTFAYGSFGVRDDVGEVAAATWLCVSVTTGTACLVTCLVVAAAPRARCVADCRAALRWSGGSGGSGCTLGTGMTGVPVVGTTSTGSGGFDPML